MQFVGLLRTHFPQFAQMSRSGGYMQQDAEEFYNTAMMSLDGGLASAGDSLQSYIGFEMEETLSCAETEAEVPTTRSERVNKLVCNIQGGVGSSVVVDHLHEGLHLGLEGTVEKNSEVLGRNAVWNKKQRMNSLPRYLCVQFMRFFWKPTPESMDHAGVKCKILRPVTFPEVLDVLDLCSERMTSLLMRNRRREEKLREQELERISREMMTDGDAATAPALATEAAGAAAGEGKGAEEMEVERAGISAAAVEEEALPGEGAFGEGIPSSFTGKYELMGVVTHKGRSADSGHYIGWVRQEPGSSVWWKFDDAVVSEVSTEEILALKGGGDWHTAYLNFYRYRE